MTMAIKGVLAIVGGFCGMVACALPCAATFDRMPEVGKFIDEIVVKHDFDRSQLQRWFSHAQVQNSVLRAMSTPGTARPWHSYRASQVTDARIRGGVDYWRRHAAILARASAEFGVPEEMIAATIGIETHYGRTLGTNVVFDTLATLAFLYPRRAELFRAELEQFLLLTRELDVAPRNYKGSYAGAVGVSQFLPGSYRRHAVDFDKDGRRDLWSHADAIGSVANYYKAYGWTSGERVIVALEQPSESAGQELQRLLERGLNPHTTVAALRASGLMPVEPVPDDALASVITAESESGPRYWLAFNNFYVITRYNRSVNYALAVHDLALELRHALSLERR